MNWDETNAALGLILQFLCFMQKRLKIEFSLVGRFEINGSMSKIVGKKDNISFKDSYSIFGPVKDEHNFQIGLYLMLQC